MFNNPFLYSDSFQMGWGLKKYNFFSNFFLPVCANSYYLHKTSSPFMFCCAPTRNPLGPCRRNASGSKGDISAISLLSLINLSSYPHFGAALSARQPSRAANRKITRESCNRAKPGRGDSDTRQSQSQWTLIINNHLQIESRHRTRCLESSSIDPDNPETQTIVDSW